MNRSKTRKRPAKERGERGNSGFAPKVLRLLRDSLGQLTSSQKVLALYLLQHPEKIGYLSIRDLAKSAGVSIATVFRLCRHLGYEGYIELGREVQQSVQYELSTPTRFRLGTDPLFIQSSGPVSAFERVVAVEMDSLASMARTIRMDDLSRCIRWMNEADHVVVAATMGSTSLAEYMGYALSKVLSSVRLITAVAGSDTWYHFKGLTEKSLVFIVGFPRYPQSTLDIGAQLKKGGCRVVAVTDHYRSPLTAVSDIVFPIPISFSTVVDSFTAPVAFIHGLVAEYSERHRDEGRVHLQEFEDYTAQSNAWAQSPARPPGTPRRRSL